MGMGMGVNVVLAAVILLIAILLSRVSSRIGLPALLAFLALGMAVAGLNDEIKVISNDRFVKNFCSFALIFIMFYGGFGVNWRRSSSVAVKAGVLASLGVVLTAACVCLFVHFALGVAWVASAMLGSVISSTDAASVFAILRSKKMNLKYNTASLLEIESGSNDPAANMLMLISIALLQGSVEKTFVVELLVKQVLLGAVFGVLIGCLARYLMRVVRPSADEMGVIFLIAIAMLAYGLADVTGGNGYLATYLAGIILGNSPLASKQAKVHFFNGITGLMQVLIFFLLGYISEPGGMLHWIKPGLTVSAFLMGIARPAVVFLLMLPLGCTLKQCAFVSWCGLRGASAIVFMLIASLTTAGSNQIDQGLVQIVLWVVLSSILVQGSLIPVMAKRFDMLDNKDDVMETFSDYSSEAPIDFIRLKLAEKHPWVNRTLAQIHLEQILTGSQVVLIVREGKQLIPRGGTRLLAGDELIIGGSSVQGEKLGSLSFVSVDKKNEWASRRIREIPWGASNVIAIQREGGLLVPTGETVIRAGDTVVLNEVE